MRVAEAATLSNRGRKRRLTDSAWKRKKKETNALNKDLRRTRVRSLERFKDSPEVENSHSGILFIPYTTKLEPYHFSVRKHHGC
jgi:hypothetical protein